MNNIHQNKNKKKIVQEVFNKASDNYDLMNDLMSLGSHRLWKKQMINNLNIKNNDSIIDMASGTGDLSKIILKNNNNQKIFRVDPNQEMLNKNKIFFRNYQNVVSINNFAENLSIESNSIDKYIISFGLRNFTNIDKSLSEAFRVLKIGGQFCCMEFYKVEKPILREIYNFYIKFLPKLGKIFSGDEKPYKYLGKSILDFYSQIEIQQKLTDNRFKNIYLEDLFSGIVTIHYAWKLDD